MPGGIVGCSVDVVVFVRSVSVFDGRPQLRRSVRKCANVFTLGQLKLMSSHGMCQSDQ